MKQTISPLAQEIAEAVFNRTKSGKISFQDYYISVARDVQEKLSFFSYFLRDLRASTLSGCLRLFGLFGSARLVIFLRFCILVVILVMQKLLHQNIRALHLWGLIQPQQPQRRSVATYSLCIPQVIHKNLYRFY